MQRDTSKMKYLSLLVIALWAALGGAAAAEEGLYVHRIAVDPANPRVLYAATDNQGVLKSTDGGRSWRLANRGIRTYLLYDLAIHPRDSKRLYLGSWGGGIYRSQDAGESWSERNDGLGNTAVWTVLLSGPRLDTLLVLTSSGVYRGLDGGREWRRLGTPFVEDEELPQALVELPGKPGTLVLGTTGGLYTLNESETRWVPSGEDGPDQVTALAYNKHIGSVYSGTMNRGLYESRDSGRTWRHIPGLDEAWINEIRVHPEQGETVYVTTRTHGILKTRDGGRTWREMGREIGDRWVTTLAFDPRSPDILYAGTHEKGIHRSKDGGLTWQPLLEQAIQSPEARNRALTPRPIPDRTHGPPPPPPAFRKCNECHGWTHPALDMARPTYYRMTANPRDWTATVRRMSRRAQLEPGEANQLIDYLNRYFGPKTAVEKRGHR